MRVGAAVVDITPSLPVDLLGHVRRPLAARAVDRPLQARACLFRDEETTVVILTADLAGMTPAFAARIRTAVAEAVGCSSPDIVVSCSHTHAAPWPDAANKLGGEFDGWSPGELAYRETLPGAFASAAIQADARAVEARVSGGVGRAPAIAVNRRERTPDGRTILGWNPDGFIDDAVPTIRIDGAADGPTGAPLATLVGFGCHPVVVGPDVDAVSSDFVGPLRDRLDHDLRPGSTTLFLQGAGGNVLPAEGFHVRSGPEVPMGERLALEAAHAVIDLDPWVSDIERIQSGSLHPIALYRRRHADVQPVQVLRSVNRIVSLPLLPPPSLDEVERELVERQTDLDGRLDRGEGRASTNLVRYHVNWLERMLSMVRAGPLPSALDAEIWAARIGDCAIVTAPGEVFSEIGFAIRSASPAAVTIFGGYANGVLGYIPTAAEYPFGGYEPSVSHRGYGQPAPFAPDAARIVETAAVELLVALFPP